MKLAVRLEKFARFAMPAAALVLFAAAEGRAATMKFDIDPGHSGVNFKVRHLVAKTPGRFTDFSGAITMDPAKPTEGAVEFVIKSTSVDTGNAKRDGHLRSADFFDVEKFPEITFKSTRITAKGGNLYDVTGILTMHGVANPIVLTVEMNGPGPHAFIPGGQAAGFSLSTKINRKDFGIVWNKTLDAGGTVLGDEVEVSIDLETGYKPAEKPADKPADAPAKAPAKK